MMEDPKSPAKPEKEAGPIVKDGVLKLADLPKVMAEFRKPLPDEGLQSTKGEETKKGYDTLGYGYAYVSERLNDVVGFCWRMVTRDEVIKDVKSNQGNDMYDVSIDVVIQLGNWKNKEIEDTEQDIQVETLSDGKPSSSTYVQKVYKIVREFEVLAETPVGYGWHKGMAKADARKGAMTNGFKKAAGFFGIGNDAYKKSIDEENQQIKDTLAKKNAKKKPVMTSTKPVGQGNIALIKQKLAGMGAKTEEAALLLLAEKYNFDCDGLDKLNEKQQKMILARILQQKS